MLYMVDLQSWTKVLGQMCTCGSLQTRETKSRATFNQHEPNPSPHPTYNVENTYPQLFLTFNIVLGGGGGNCNVVLKYGNAFRRSAQIFDNYGFCITVPRYFVQDCSFGVCGWNLLGPVVQNAINANPRLKINQGVYFCIPKRCSTLIFCKILY